MTGRTNLEKRKHFANSKLLEVITLDETLVIDDDEASENKEVELIDLVMTSAIVSARSLNSTDDSIYLVDDDSQNEGINSSVNIINDDDVILVDETTDENTRKNKSVSRSSQMNVGRPAAGKSSENVQQFGSNGSKDRNQDNISLVLSSSVLQLDCAAGPSDASNSQNKVSQMQPTSSPWQSLKFQRNGKLHISEIRNVSNLSHGHTTQLCKSAETTSVVRVSDSNVCQSQTDQAAQLSLVTDISRGPNAADLCSKANESSRLESNWNWRSFLGKTSKVHGFFQKHSVSADTPSSSALTNNKMNASDESSPSRKRKLHGMKQKKSKRKRCTIQEDNTRKGIQDSGLTTVPQAEVASVTAASSSLLPGRTVKMVWTKPAHLSVLVQSNVVRPQEPADRQPVAASLGSKKHSGIDSTNICNPEPVSLQPSGSLRPVVVDACNVAYGHGKTHFSSRGLEICINYFLKRGHTVKAFMPLSRKCGGSTSDPHILTELEKQGHLIMTPSRRVQGRLIVPYDDRFIVQFANEVGAVIVTTDNYRDLLSENPDWRETIENRLLMFTWVDDILMFPHDPLGRNGPNLKDFLKFP